MLIKKDRYVLCGSTTVGTVAVFVSSWNMDKRLSIIDSMDRIKR